MSYFPFGKAPFFILIATLLAAFWLFLHPVADKKQSELVMWVFAKTHRDAYVRALPGFQNRNPGIQPDIKLINFEVVNRNLLSAFWSDLDDVPDLAEVEIGWVGTFFKGPVDQIGFMDLKPLLDASGYFDKMVRSRFAAYTNRGHIFGVPHDVHPVMLAYRRDLIESLGIDTASLSTWSGFIEAGRRHTLPGKRYMLEFSDANSSSFETLLFQRNGGYFDSLGNVIFDNETAVQTMLFCIPLVAGPNAIATNLGSSQSGDVLFYKALEDGYYLFCLCPDWRSSFIQEYAPRLSGKMALMPLPAFEPGGRRTSTMGGTMLGITQKCKNREAAWKLIERLYMNPEGLSESFKKTNIIPPYKGAWSHPVFSEKRAFWSDQPVGSLFISLADQVPPQYSSPYVVLSKNKLGEAVVNCSEYYRSHGEAGFEAYARARLKSAADEIRRYQGRSQLDR